MKKNPTTVIVLKNNTVSTIEIIDCEDLNDKQSFPFTLESSGSEKVVCDGLVDSTDFIVLYNNENYSFSTEYIQDSSKLTITFTDNNNSLCAVLNDSDGKHNLEINKIKTSFSYFFHLDFFSFFLYFFLVNGCCSCEDGSNIVKVFYLNLI